MLFIEPRFFGFFLIVFGVHWALRSARLRKLWLLAASYAFYAGWDWRFLGLILLSTGVDYLAGLRIAAARGAGEAGSGATRRLWLGVSLTCNLGLLGFFKYFDFFAASGAHFLGWLGLHPSDVTLNLVLPVGISFYTFQTLSYTLDVYRGSLEPSRRLSDFALFVAFFPQLVAGPIVRASQFLPQLERPRRFLRDVPLRACLVLVLVGFVKKICLADNAALAVDRVWADPGAFDAASVWLSFSLYSVQIYGDFSGYSDMAIGLAGLLGYRLPENFRHPFFAHNIVQFWQRWHISLSTWLRDYLFLPLAKRWSSPQGRVAGLVVTMLLCGLWHGASARFLVFGALHAAYLLAHRLWLAWDKPAGWRALGAWLGMPVTYVLMTLSWPLFRGAEGGVAELFRALLPFGERGEAHLAGVWWGLLLTLVVLHLATYRLPLNSIGARLRGGWFALGYGAAWALALPLVAVDHQPFVYFQF